MLKRKKQISETPKRVRRKTAPVRAVKGMRDILPQEWFVWDYILSESEKLCRDFGFGKIEVPILEHTELFKRGNT